MFIFWAILQVLELDIFKVLHLALSPRGPQCAWAFIIYNNVSTANKPFMGSSAFRFYFLFSFIAIQINYSFTPYKTSIPEA